MSKMSKNVKILISSIVGAIVLLLIGLYISREYTLPHFKGVNHYQKNWNLEIKNLDYKENISLPYQLNYKTSSKHSLSTKLTYSPKDNESPYAFLSMNHMYFKVYLDNDEIYSYAKNEVPTFSKSPGNSYAMVQLPKDCYGKIFQVDFWPTLESGLVYEMPDIIFGDCLTVLHQTHKDNILHFIFIICILFIGIILFIISCVIVKDEIRKDAQHIGWFAITLGIYNLTENLYSLFMISNTYITYLINFIVFAIIPIPFLSFFMHKVVEKYKKLYYIVISCAVANIVIQIILHFSKILDLRQNVIYTHIIYLISILLIIFTLIVTPKNYYPNKNILILSVVPIAIGSIFDSFFHYTNSYAHEKNTGYVNLGVFIFLLVQASLCVFDIISTYKENIKSQFYKSLAFKDSLTGIGNRTAYMNEINKINNSKKISKKCICIYIDLNNLKIINDSYGHDTGDELICKTTSIIDNYLGCYGNLFRFGGDEFICIVYNLSETKLENILEKMYDDIQNHNNTTDIKVDFSLGYKKLEPHETVEECISIADKNMYENKLKNRLDNKQNSI